MPQGTLMLVNSRIVGQPEINPRVRPDRANFCVARDLGEIAMGGPGSIGTRSS